MDLYNNQVIEAKPFLKWVGGKRQLIPIIEENLPNNIKKTRSIKNYFEPFIGGGALFFHLKSFYSIKNSYISDINTELILTYNVIKKDHKSLIKILEENEKNYLKLDPTERKEYYLNIRHDYNEKVKDFDYTVYDQESIIRASQIIFMNKTCFNGLFRVNKKGEFNVPHGRYTNPTICNEENITNVHNILKDVNIQNTSYLTSEKYIDENSFVYLDPPYRPLNKTSSFTSYSNNGFDDDNQIELSDYYKRISDKGAYAMLSNSDPHNVDETDNFFDELYNQFNIQRINANRSINSNAEKRGPINELLITNYR